MLESQQSGDVPTDQEHPATWGSQGMRELRRAHFTDVAPGCHLGSSRSACSLSLRGASSNRLQWLRPAPCPGQSPAPKIVHLPGSMATGWDIGRARTRNKNRMAPATGKRVWAELLRREAFTDVKLWREVALSSGRGRSPALVPGGRRSLCL